MYILSVIPIQRGIPFSTLSYFSSDALGAGTIVEIPLGRQTIYGLVYGSVSLIEAKTDIKQATFALKKIKSVVGVSNFSRGVAEGLSDASKKTLIPIGALAGVFIHENFFDFFHEPMELVDGEKADSTPRAVYGSTLERTDEYKRIIRTAFADKKSVVLVAPSIRSVEFWYKTLQKGITAHSLCLHSKRTKRDQKQALSLIKNAERPLFIVTTPGFSIIPRSDIETVILEEESSTLYKTNDRYEVDQRIGIESIAKALGLQLIYGDILPRFETLQKTNQLELPRAFTPEKLLVVPTDPYRTILPSETVELIRYCQKNKKTLFIYTNRKGIAPLSRCADCGTTVECPSCGLPVVLRYKIIDGTRERLFICTHCGDTLPPTHVCSYCASWNIAPVPVGTESIAASVEEIIGTDHVAIVDDDTTPDSKQVQSLIEELQKKKWFVLVGTQKLLPYIKSIDFIAVPFFDRILSIASPYTIEEVLHLIMECNERVKEKLILCTKNPDFPILKQLATKKLQEIIDEDIETRKTLSYPPFGVLLKLSVTLPQAHRESVSRRIEYFFSDHELSLLSARRITPESMKVVCTWIIQVDQDYLENYGESLSLFLSDIRFPNKLEINPRRL